MERYEREGASVVLFGWNVFVMVASLLVRQSAPAGVGNPLRPVVVCYILSFPQRPLHSCRPPMYQPYW